MPKKKAAPQGAPEWVLTYGDLMSLLLCFFIMIASMSSVGETNPKVVEALNSIKEAFGLSGQVGIVVDKTIDMRSLVRKLEEIANRGRLATEGRAMDKGVQGRQLTVRKIRDGAEVTIGGPVVFERFSAVLRPEGDEAVTELAKALVGHLNVIEVQGHATAEPLPPESSFANPMDLSIARAKAVAAKLVQCGVNPRTIRIVGVGANAPLVKQAYTPERLAENRRVVVIVRESVISEYEGTPHPAEGGAEAGAAPR